jgi:hypothetical protein
MGSVEKFNPERTSVGHMLQDAPALLLDAPGSVLFPPRMAIKPNKLPGAARLAGTRFVPRFGNEETFRVAAYDQEKAEDSIALNAVNG